MPALVRTGAAALLAAALLALSACGGGDQPAAAPAAATPGATPEARNGAAATPQPQARPGAGGAAVAKPTRARLKAAAQDYADALLSGDFLAVVPLLDVTCTEQDRDALAGAMGVVKRIAKDSRMTITRVRIVGDTGAPTGYRLSARAPARLRTVVRQAFLASPGTNPWRFVDGRWLNTGPCSGTEQQGTPV